MLRQRDVVAALLQEHDAAGLTNVVHLLSTALLLQLLLLVPAGCWVGTLAGLGDLCNWSMRCMLVGLAGLKMCCVTCQHVWYRNLAAARGPAVSSCSVFWLGVSEFGLGQSLKDGTLSASALAGSPLQTRRLIFNVSTSGARIIVRTVWESDWQVHCCLSLLMACYTNTVCIPAATCYKLPPTQQLKKRPPSDECQPRAVLVGKEHEVDALTSAAWQACL
jgi:hypothetical protein